MEYVEVERSHLQVSLGDRRAELKKIISDYMLSIEEKTSSQSEDKPVRVGRRKSFGQKVKKENSSPKKRVEVKEELSGESRIGWSVLWVVVVPDGISQSQEGEEDFSDQSEEDVEVDQKLVLKKTFRADDLLSAVVGEELVTRSEVCFV